MYTLNIYCNPFGTCTQGLIMCHSPISVFPMTSLCCGFSLPTLWGYLSLRASSCCRVVGLNHWTLGPWIASGLGGWSYMYKWGQITKWNFKSLVVYLESWRKDQFLRRIQWNKFWAVKQHRRSFNGTGFQIIQRIILATSGSSTTVILE